MHRIGTAAALWRYPVKGLAAEPLRSVEVGPQGLAGDRAGAMFVRDAGHVRFDRPFRGKEHHRLHLCRSIAEAAALGASEAVALEYRSDGPYFDDEAVSVIVDAWLAEAARMCGRPLEPLRFRPNVFVDAGPAAGLFPPEASLQGAALAIGSVRLRVTAPIGRCVTITYDPLTGTADPEVGRAIAQRRGNIMGVYCAVEIGGTIAQGDPSRSIARHRHRRHRWAAPSARVDRSRREVRGDGRAFRRGARAGAARTRDRRPRFCGRRCDLRDHHRLRPPGQRPHRSGRRGTAAIESGPQSRGRDGRPAARSAGSRRAALARERALGGPFGDRSETLDLQIALLNRGVTPVVPAQGSVGASGDLAPLAHMTLILIGEGEAFFEGERLPGAEALRRAGLAPVRLRAKEGLSLINGTQVMTGIAASAAAGRAAAGCGRRNRRDVGGSVPRNR